MPRKPKQPTPDSNPKPKRTPTPRVPKSVPPRSDDRRQTTDDEHSSAPSTSKIQTPGGYPKSKNIQEFAQRYPFPLDPFQEEAIAHLDTGDSVMVAAPTGTGKTVVAEFGIFRAHREGYKVMYTTPIKALSNQKFRDLREQYGDAVGLLTGDVIENREGSIMVMTTEVLRNMLLQTPSELWGVGCIIFDEIHYLADPERGTTWEESIIMCPEHIQLVCLSATVTNAPEIAEWIGRTHAPIHLITHLQRAVPLSLYYFLDGQLQLVINEKGQQIADFNVGGEVRKKGGNRYRGPVLEEDTSRPDERREPTSREIVESLEDADLLPAIYFLFSRKDCEAAAELCAMTRLKSLGSMQQAEGSSEEQANSRHPSKSKIQNPRSKIEEVLATYLDRLSPEDRKLEQVQTIIYLARRGFGFHHAGLLPILKQLVEELFNKSLMRVVFATDTLALGVNMPARTVVIGRMSKFDGVSRRPLIPNEFQQMSGRAGRRGIDPQGHVVLPYSPWVTFHEALNIATGPLRPVESAFTMRYNSVLNLWGRGSEGRRHKAGGSSEEPPKDEARITQEDLSSSFVIRHLSNSEIQSPKSKIGEDEPSSRVIRVMRASLLQFQQSRRLRDLERDLDEEEARLAEVPVGCLIGYDNGEELLDEYERLGRVVEETRRREKKVEQNLAYLHSRRDSLPWKRPERDVLRREFRTLPQGALVHIEGRGWAIYLGRGLGAVIGLFLPVADDGRRTTGDVVKSEIGEVFALAEYLTIDYLLADPVVVELPYALSTLSVAPTVPFGELLGADELQALKANVAQALDNLPDLEGWVAEHRATQEQQVEVAAVEVRAELDTIRAELGQVAEAERTHVCHACPVRKEHRTYRRTRARLLLDRDAVEKRLHDRQRFEDTRLQNILKGLTSVLVQFHYLRKGALTHKADKLADIFDTNALMIVEMVEGNYFEGLQAEDVAEVFSWFAYDRDIDFLNRLLIPRYLINLRRDLDHLQNAIFAAERRQGISLTRGYNPYFFGAARAWCRGASIADLLDQVEISEGDMVMTFNKTLDIMRQVRDMLGRYDRDNPLYGQLHEADRLVRRGVVEMVNAIGFAPLEDARVDSNTPDS